MRKEKMRKVVKERYAKFARQGKSCCGSAASVQDISRKVGYSEQELKAAPKGANLGLGCGDPVALASLREGETVLDLGSGAGLDCFLVADKVGKKGRVIGVDMTPEMIEKARKNAEEGNYKNIEFRLGEIENLPAADNSIDVVISNCVINLVPDKRKAFREAFRVLKPGGRLMISDIVLLKKLPDFIKSSVDAYVVCVSGAMQKDEYIRAIKAAGFEEVRIVDEVSFPIECVADDPTAKAIIKNSKILVEKAKEVTNSVASIKVCGVKPTGKTSIY